jgi:hypothetical protein
MHHFVAASLGNAVLLGDLPNGHQPVWCQREVDQRPQRIVCIVGQSQTLILRLAVDWA